MDLHIIVYPVKMTNEHEYRNKTLKRMLSVKSIYISKSGL